MQAKAASEAAEHAEEKSEEKAQEEKKNEEVKAAVEAEAKPAEVVEEHVQPVHEAEQHDPSEMSGMIYKTKKEEHKVETVHKPESEPETQNQNSASKAEFMSSFPTFLPKSASPGFGAGDPVFNRETKFVFKDCHGTGMYVCVYTHQ